MVRIVTLNGGTKPLDEVAYECTMHGCRVCKGNKLICRHCGFEKTEVERRKALPLVKDKDGLKRKHVGIKYE